MKKIILAIALVGTAFAASAHPFPATHYHTPDGHVVVGNTFYPSTVVSYEADGYGRRVIVTNTTRCTDVDVNRMNNHLICREQETTTEREYVDGRYDNYRPGYGIVSPIIRNDYYRNDHRWNNDHRGHWNNDPRGHDRGEHHGDHRR